MARAKQKSKRVAPPAPALRENQDESLDVAGMLASCETGFVPANELVDVAIAAHRIAWERFCSDGSETSRRLGEYLIRAILVARTSTSEDTEAAFSYLEDLPIEAWPEMPNHSRQEIREKTLRSWTAQAA